MRHVMPMVCALILLGATARAAEPTLQAAFDANGLKSLKTGDAELAKLPVPALASVTLESTTLDENGYKKYAFEKADLTGGKVSFDEAKKTWRAEYAWGGVEVLYKPAGNRLDLDVTLTNTSQKTLADFDLALMQLHLPSAPTNWKKGPPRTASALDNLALTTCDFPDARLLLCNLSVDPPFYFGFAKPAAGAPLDLPVVLRGGVYVAAPGAYTVEPHGLPRVEAGQRLTLSVTVRVAAAGANAYEAVGEAAEAFRKHYAPMRAWEDRRPIGMLMRSSNYKDHKSATNPRGWFNNPKIDITTPDGKANFKELALKDAANCVKTLKAADAQGMIFWDVEGSENPHPITYLGDARLAKKLAPEFDEIADDYFKVFADAGIRTGVCIRPSQVYWDEKKKTWNHGTGSDGAEERGNHYSAIHPKDVPWWKFFPIAERLSDKVAYAKKRWGCTIFYIDTNGTFQPVGEEQKFEWMLVNAMAWRKVQADHPDVLLIPELPHDNFAWHAAQWAFCAQYMELDMGGYGTPAGIQALLPKAFSVVNVCDGDFVKHREELKAAVARGDILMIHGWFGSNRNKEAKALYDEVKGQGKTAEAKPADAKPADAKPAK
ncbi:MAG: hypothetical protein KIS92_10460 [Planctomycetota bacterium]|nr:hypothetical protein [Planctomycetota bacterium]